MARYFMTKIVLFGILTLGCLLPALAIPGNITISGRLLDASGNPIHYYEMIPNFMGVPVKTEVEAKLKVRLDFFDSETAPTFFSILYTTATAENGYFSIRFVPPALMMAKDVVWYDLSIDADRNGLTGSDQFAGRFELGSVPFALSAKPLKSFTIFGGVTQSGHEPAYPDLKNLMMVCPFESPAGGVEFNQMNIYLLDADGGARFSYGIYDESGARIAYSGLITIPATVESLNRAFLQVKVPNMKLQPSAIYYVGLSRDPNMYFPFALAPVAPVLGTISNPNHKGGSPAKFNPADIDPNMDINILPVTLCQVDESKPEVGWVSKPGQPSYRWIQSKSGTQAKASRVKK